MVHFLRTLIPELAPVSARERLRSAAGALFGILVTGLVSRLALGDAASLPVLIAPMGASAVLLFAVPASPLAQPWSILGGNLVGAAAGVLVAALIHDPFVASAVAIALAIAGMMALRCLHPPSGAVALTAVLGGAAVRDLGYGFVLWPVGVNTLLLLASAVLFNNLTGHPYPNLARPNARKERRPRGAPAGPTSFASSDLDEVLRSRDALLEISRSDLEAILREVQTRSFARRSGSTTCAEVMSRAVVAIAPGAPLQEALDLLRLHFIKALPVTDERAFVLGIVTQTDLLAKANWNSLGPRLGLARRIRLTLRRGRAPTGTVEDIMTRGVTIVRPDTRVGEAMRVMLNDDHHHLPVVGADDKLVGMVSQTDVVSALLANGSLRAA